MTSLCAYSNASLNSQREAFLVAVDWQKPTTCQNTENKDCRVFSTNWNLWHMLFPQSIGIMEEEGV